MGEQAKGRPGRRPRYVEETEKMSGRLPATLRRRLLADANHRNTVGETSDWKPWSVLVQIGLDHYDLGHLRRTED